MEAQNAHGDWVAPTRESLDVSLAAGTSMNVAAFDDVPGGYPLVHINRLYTVAGTLAPDEANALAAAIRFIATDGQQTAIDNGGTDLPDDLRLEALAKADAIVEANCDAEGYEVTTSGPSRFEPATPGVQALTSMRHCTPVPVPATTTTTTEAPTTTAEATTTTVAPTVAPAPLPTSPPVTAPPFVPQRSSPSPPPVVVATTSVATPLPETTTTSTTVVLASEPPALPTPELTGGAGARPWCRRRSCRWCAPTTARRASSWAPSCWVRRCSCSAVRGAGAAACTVSVQEAPIRSDPLIDLPAKGAQLPWAPERPRRERRHDIRRIVGARRSSWCWILAVYAVHRRLIATLVHQQRQQHLAAELGTLRRRRSTAAMRWGCCRSSRCW